MYKILATLVIIILRLHHIICILPQCTLRLENSELIKEADPRLNNCTYVQELYPACKDSIIVRYAEEPPYVVAPKTGDDGTPTGLLPDILNQTFYTCCFGCKKMIFQPTDHYEKFNTTMKADILMPVQSTTNSIDFNGVDFVPLVTTSKVLMLAKQRTEEEKDKELTRQMFYAAVATWPLFVVAVLLAFTAGCFIWVLDTWFNEKHFPRRFPIGICDGFWWAVVTMTTVGYGDKVPLNIISRLFSIFWIFLGITMFNMLTAVLTSTLDLEDHIFVLNNFSDMDIGVLKSSSLGRTAVLLENGNDIQYNYAYELAKALKKDEIKAISIDAIKAAYYMDEFQKHVPFIKTHHSVEDIDHAYGILSKHGNLTRFINSFFLTNGDHRKSMASYIMHKRWPKKKLIEKVVKKARFFNLNSPLFKYTLIVLFIVSFLLIVFGSVFRHYCSNNTNVLTRYVDLMNAEFDVCKSCYTDETQSSETKDKKRVINEIEDFDNISNSQVDDTKTEDENREPLVTTEENQIVKI